VGFNEVGCEKTISEVQRMDLAEIFYRLAISLGLGLLVGLQRQRALSQLAGIRTFALITLFGSVSGLLAMEFSGWVVAAGAVALASLLIIGNVAQMRSDTAGPGMTTEVSALLMYGVGAYLTTGPIAVAVAVGGTTALLLHFKDTMHTFVARIGENDVRAIMQFVVIAFVILPVLPDETFGPYDVLNPHDIWRMVVLIVGISLGGYVAYKLLGDAMGTLVAGLLGGLISSTATTISYARRTQEQEDLAPFAGLVIVLATIVSLGRQAAEVAVVASDAFIPLAIPLMIVMATMGAVAAVSYFLVKHDAVKIPEPRNPAGLRTALIFGGLYAFITLAIAAARDLFGGAGLYSVAMLSGLHDVDAITLSAAHQTTTEQIDIDQAWRVILLAALANLFMKGLYAALIGGRRLLMWIAVPFGLGLAIGVLLLLNVVPLADVLPARTESRKAVDVAPHAH